MLYVCAILAVPMVDFVYRATERLTPYKILFLFQLSTRLIPNRLSKKIISVYIRMVSECYVSKLFVTIGVH